MASARYAFEAQWFDPFAQLLKNFSVVFYEAEGQVEIYDVATRKTFLKRCEPPEAVSLKDFYIGGIVTLFSRQFKITGFGDAATERRLKVARSVTLGIVTSDALINAGKILTAIQASGLTVGRVALLALSESQATNIVSARSPADQRRLVPQLSSGPSLALEIVGDDCVNRWHEVMGPQDPADARAAAPRSLRAVYGRSLAANAVYGSATAEDAARDISLVFDGELTYTARYRNCAVCIVKPHAAASGALATVLETLLSQPDLSVSAVRSLAFTRAQAEDYYEAYRGVVDEAARWVAELASGQSYVIEVVGDDAVAKLRALAGPYIPEVAAIIAPDSLRASLGVDTVRNGVHVTDLGLDGPLESKFLFHVL